jgi:hypothetical protein
MNPFWLLVALFVGICFGFVAGVIAGVTAEVWNEDDERTESKRSHPSNYLNDEV